ncbi:TPA: acyltransferase family protein [Enterobacter roggenkampii]|uniref:acyltransferase family protein n=1 Tax=Enterobacter roggenkampii TaxID=1812935 RepID=UPI003C6F4009
MKKSLDGLTILRCVFAIYVFIFHIGINGGASVDGILESIRNNGAVSMSFFFLLSGFVLAYAYDGKEISYKDFISKRIKRIYPAYILFGLITLPQLLVKPILEAASSLLLFSTATQAWVYQSLPSWGFSGSWTVSVEMFFYFVFPLLLPIIKNNIKLSLALSFAVASVLIPISEVYSIDFSPIRSIYYSTPIYRLPEFIFGVGIGLAFNRGYRVSMPVMLLGILVLLSALSTDNNYGFMAYNAFFIPSISLIIIYFAGINIPKNHITKPLIYFGSMSYSFYLMQVAIFVWVDSTEYLKEYFYNGSGWASLIVLTVFSSVICHELTEGKLYKLIKTL